MENWSTTPVLVQQVTFIGWNVFLLNLQRILHKGLSARDLLSLLYMRSQVRFAICNK